MPENRSAFQLVWGILLTAAGIGVFFRVPQVMPKIEMIQAFSDAAGYIRFCFYFIGILLVGGGVKKIYHHLAVPGKPKPGTDGTSDGRPIETE